MSILASVPLAPRDPILGLTEQFNADDRPGKVNLGVGVYQDEHGKVPLLDCVRTAEARLDRAPVARSYLPIDGLPAYDRLVRELIFGADSAAVAAGQVTTVQTLGGTGGLKIGAEFLKTTGAGRRVLISTPSWENHHALFTKAGFEVGSYRYYDRDLGGVDVAGMLADLAAATPGTIVVLHGCCHNPTGYDLTSSQWQQVAAAVVERGLVPFVDLAYQGFSEGLEPDGAVPRQFAELGVPVLVSTSFSKSFSLYGERVGSLSVISADDEEAARVLSQLKVAVRTTYSNPPTHGAAVVAAVLADLELRAGWEAELAGMRDRIKGMRRALLAGLAAAGVDGWGFLTEQVGMFSYTGLSAEQMRVLRDEHAVYGTDAGRICVAALNDSNVEAVARAIAAVV
ncbi:MAG: amino acid aminotransferase [Propionicimonas sp.]|uniref:amino acid aminotransferase n=1 Tax=Propionicimonas sp. TaxID=1955623 RepID=UPI002B220B1E|nr:amino acid aminotransferase [Propionicimonas sp.]MEA4942815.1 amino acid aminotransferase [Propionicimonas sp.]